MDNSNYNKGWGETIWKSGVSESEENKYYPQESSKPFKVQEITRIVFNGYYGKQLHFTFETIKKIMFFDKNLLLIIFQPMSFQSA